MSPLQKIHDLLNNKVTIPQEYKTTQAWSEHWGVSDCQARRLIQGLIQKKLCDSQSFKVKNIAGHYKPVNHYKIHGSK